MAIPKFLEDLAIISKLGDNPGADNGLSTSAFRAKFDEAALKIQAFINDVIIPEIGAQNSPEDGLNMRGNISMGRNRIRGLPSPAQDDEAAPKEYVDAAVQTAVETAVDEATQSAKDYADSRKKTHKVNLSASSWENNTQTVAVSGVTADETKSDVIPSPGTADENYAAYLECGVRISAQHNGAVTFKCDSVPNRDLAVNVMVLT